MLKLVGKLDFENEVMKSDGLVVVDFFATWCGPCKMIAPILEQLSEEFGDTVKIVKIDVDEDREIANLYSIKSMPTLIFLKYGEIVDKIVGQAPSKSELKSRIASFI